MMSSSCRTFAPTRRTLRAAASIVAPCTMKSDGAGTATACAGSGTGVRSAGAAATTAALLARATNTEETIWARMFVVLSAMRDHGFPWHGIPPHRGLICDEARVVHRRHTATRVA